MNPGLKSTLLIAVIAHFANPTGATVVTPAPDTRVGRITLTTTQAGFPLPAGQVIQDYPLLVRFDGDQFPWGEANPDGSDITFENNANVQLPASIEESIHHDILKIVEMLKEKGGDSLVKNIDVIKKNIV